MSRSDAIREIAGRLSRARRVTVLTGAGVSAASGIPTFRGEGGLWKSFRAEQLATPEAFERDPKLVWEWYDWRRAKVASCRPNRAHEVLAAWSRRWARFTLVTQNVDGLHEEAGTENTVRFHGSIWEVRCWNECAGSPERWVDRTLPFPTLPPPCPYCDGIVRPGVVWFGEAIPRDALGAAGRAVECDVFLTVGTSSLVYPAAGLAAGARSGGAYTAEINLQPTPMSAMVDTCVPGPAEVSLDEIDRRLGTANDD